MPNTLPHRVRSTTRLATWGALLLLPTAAILASAALASFSSPQAAATTKSAVPTPEPLLFARDIRPILANNCLKCHGPDDQARQGRLRLDIRGDETTPGATTGGKSGKPAIIPGDAEHSEIIRRIQSTDPDRRMPPPEVNKHGVKPEDVATLKRWINDWAPWSPHWSFVPPVSAPPPKVSNPKWARKAFDLHVLARLDREQLSPAAEAPRATLLRRASLDLTGLPPTPAELDAFLADTSADAYERTVDRLLASPHFGEKWARWWLDLARYADTKGYEKDERRTMWPYRDWVINAFNSGMRFDQFTSEQLAGDMLDSGGAAVDAQTLHNRLVATAFHRNTMTNDEGGTDDEEFRTAAVIDRTNTTMEVWQGLTAGCAQCHTHKYDPISHTDYYRLLAIFNNTMDADRADEDPTIPVIRHGSEARYAALNKAADDAEARIKARLAAVPDSALEHAPGEPATGRSERATRSGEAADRAYIDDLLPIGATPMTNGDAIAPWPWFTPKLPTDVAPQRGTRSFRHSAQGVSQIILYEPLLPLHVNAGEAIYTHVYLDPASKPRTIMLQFYSAKLGWSHRAHWGVEGEKLIPFDAETEGTPKRLRIGDLPEAGKWIRLEVDASKLNLEGHDITRIAFTQFDGTVYWDNMGVVSSQAPSDEYRRSFTAWIALEDAQLKATPPRSSLPDHLKAAISRPAAARTPEEIAALRDYYLRNVHEATVLACAADEATITDSRKEAGALASTGGMGLPVMRELQGAARRVSHRFNRGSYLSPEEVVEPAALPVIASVSGEQAGDRKQLAWWLMSRKNPLTGRVIANRVWEQLFGLGIVETLEDFGTQGAWPSNQPLLDELAVRFAESGWDFKGLLREIVTSSTYRQSSAASAELFARDPGNRLLARGPRFRLDGETIRDQALAASGLLSRKMFGPPVFPPQPDGLWIMIYSGDNWKTSEGEDRYRRGLYTFWRRTVPHPAMTTFDAPSREVCVSRRIRTNTPLQAFVTLNDPAFVECAQALARRVLAEGGASNEARIAYAFKLTVGRAATADETAQLNKLLASELAHFKASPEAATKAATVPIGPLPKDTDASELAAWSSAASVILNLDEMLTKD